MELCNDQLSDSPSKNSYIGSYYKPPEKLQSIPKETPEPPIDNPGIQKPKQSNQAVVDALRTLQEKIKRLERERLQAKERQQASVATTSTLSVIEGDNRKERDSKLQSVETRCKMLERQLDSMQKMVAGARKDKDDQTTQLQQEKQPNNSDNQIQREKLQQLESECLKLSRTQNLSDMKLAVLEQKLLKEEHERKLVLEKAGQLQRELDINLRLASPTALRQTKPKIISQRATLKSPRPNESPSPRHKKIPFVAGMSTSPSHSVHANVQSILHMIKHHQPQLCERVNALHRSHSCSAKKSLRMDGPTVAERDREPPEPAVQSPGSLSDLLLALQDELGQMGFEHQELIRQLDATQHREQRHELQKELENMVARMDKKGAQIIKLKKHQQTLTQQSRATNKVTKKPSTSPARSKHHQDRPSSVGQQSLHILRETQKLRNCLKQDDICWEV
ncbi:centrosomal protein CEP57L1 isoform X2 [Corythoichthys intestinalis]|uniref:centrosomal protein CEP57L1 isoform X2 n=1 Tax=Corythoichthys intestinalis TaxID=161448 RepID=UPI0025A556C6|nr:centrosomal protein CEP57L1 isoform X2 [Corythoichthys intestinalis]